MGDKPVVGRITFGPSMPPWWDKNKIKRRSQKDERKALRNIKDDIKVHKDSGSSWFRKGDGTGDRFMYDVKSTASRSSTVSVDMLDKLEREAFSHRKRGALVLNFTTDKRRYIVLNQTDFEELINKGEQK